MYVTFLFFFFFWGGGGGWVGGCSLENEDYQACL